MRAKKIERTEVMLKTVIIFQESVSDDSVNLGAVSFNCRQS
jgi:hypothetical protein